MSESTYENMTVKNPTDTQKRFFERAGWALLDYTYGAPGQDSVFTYRRRVEPNLRSTVPVYPTVETLPVIPCGSGSTSSTKDTNPKQAFADGKVPVDIVPTTAIMLTALALLDGALKYGKFNWRGSGVRSSTYIGALLRHTSAYVNGEEDAEDGVPHLAHALACLCILVDAQACGKLTDDRPPRMDIAGWTAKMTAWVPKIRKRHEGKNPKHWTIQDSPSPESPDTGPRYGC